MHTRLPREGVAKAGGRCMDNILIERLWRSLKYEEVYLNAYATVAEAKVGIGAWLDFYNEERQHQSLGYCMPAGKFTRNACGYLDDRRCRRAALPRFPNELGKRGNAGLRPHTSQRNDRNRSRHRNRRGYTLRSGSGRLTIGVHLRRFRREVRLSGSGVGINPREGDADLIPRLVHQLQWLQHRIANGAASEVYDHDISR
jgi:hypothetical protein